MKSRLGCIIIISKSSNGFYVFKRIIIATEFGPILLMRTRVCEVLSKQKSLFQISMFERIVWWLPQTRSRENTFAHTHTKKVLKLPIKCIRTKLPNHWEIDMNRKESHHRSISTGCATARPMTSEWKRAARTRWNVPQTESLLLLWFAGVANVVYLQCELPHFVCCFYRSRDIFLHGLD